MIKVDLAKLTDVFNKQTSYNIAKFLKNILFIHALNKLKLVLNELELFTRRDCQEPS